MEPVALWLEMKIKDGKLIWMRRGWREGRALGSPGSTMGEQGSRDGAGPASAAQLFCLMDGLGRQFCRRGPFPGGRGKPCCSGGYGPSCHAEEGGRANPGQETRGVPSPHSRGRVYGTPTSLALLSFGDERLSLPRLRVGAWIAEAALYSLGAGAVT